MYREFLTDLRNEKYMAKKKKQYVEEGIFSIYPDFPVLVNDNVVWPIEEMPLHFHYYLEIGYCFEGRDIFSSNNRKYHVKKNDITIAASNILHTTRSDSDEYTRWGNLYIDFDDLLKMFPSGDTKIQLLLVQEFFQDIFYIEGEEHPDILWIVKEIIRLYNGRKQNQKMQIVGLLYTLLLKIYEVFSEEIQEKKETSELPIMPAINYIYDYYMEPIKVAHLAKLCHFSESYFRKVFMEMKGMSPMDYVNSIRIREACRMLLNSTSTVRMIGEKCGYPSVTTFERNFRQRTGMLPSQWRETQKNPRKKDKNEHEIKRIYYKEM